MKSDNPESFETELQRLKPAKPPQELAVRLVNLAPARFTKQLQLSRKPKTSSSTWWWLLRWLAPGAIAASVGLGIWFRQASGSRNNLAHQAVALPIKTPVKADDVEIDRQLLTAFDAVARLPGGEPVRFRCREWMDQVVLRDSARGVVIEQRTPRLEVVPVRFETY